MVQCSERAHECAAARDYYRGFAGGGILRADVL